MRRIRVAVIGAGPAGLTAAIALATMRRARSPAEADRLAHLMWAQRDRRRLPVARKAA